VLVLLTIRALFFVGLALISVKAVLLYALSYLLFLQVLRFLDAFQHTYEVFPSRSLRQRPLIRGAPGNTSMRIPIPTC